MMPLNEMLAQGYDPKEIVEKKDDLQMPISMDHLKEAVEKTSRSVN